MPFTGSSQLLFVGALFDHVALLNFSESTWAKRLKIIISSSFKTNGPHKLESAAALLESFGDGGTINWVEKLKIDIVQTEMKFPIFGKSSFLENMVPIFHLQAWNSSKSKCNSYELITNHCVKYRTESDLYFLILDGQEYRYDSVYIRENTDQRSPYFGLFQAVNYSSLLVLSKSQLVSISINLATSFGKIL